MKEKSILKCQLVKCYYTANRDKTKDHFKNGQHESYLNNYNLKSMDEK